MRIVDVTTYRRGRRLAPGRRPLAPPRSYGAGHPFLTASSPAVAARQRTASPRSLSTMTQSRQRPSSLAWRA